MQVAALVLLGILIPAIALLFARLRRQRDLLASLQQDQQALADAWKALPADAARLLAATRSPLISIEILNPVELAATESPFAGPIGTVAPELIRRIVYQRTAEILRDELRQKGVRAEVALHGLA